MPHSGWPIGWDELSAYYGPARRRFAMGAAIAPTADDADLKIPLTLCDALRPLASAARRVLRPNQR